MRSKYPAVKEEEEVEEESPQENDADEPSTSAPLPTKKKAAPAKKKTKKRKIKKEDEEYAEVAEKAKNLREKFTVKKKSKDDDMPFLKVKNWDTKPKIRNCETHDNIVSRAEESQINKVYQIEYRSDVMQTQWKCALCHQRTSHENAGDLFGPYFVKINRNWPTFLVRKPVKIGRHDVHWIDVWFHGDCILWAPDVHLKGNQLVNLEGKLDQFWGQTCALCHQEGAAIPVNGKFVHHPCALKHGYVLDEHLFSCTPPVPIEKRARAH